ncbi:MAG: DUF3558 domain-containing protein [Sciscionella sp.]
MLSALLAAGCSSGDTAAQAGSGGAGGAEPTFDDRSSGAASSGSLSGPTEAPAVRNPLDASVYLSRPCALLSRQQVSTLGDYGPGRPGKKTDVGGGSGPSCTWDSTAEGPIIDAQLVTSDRNGLSDFYRARATMPKSYFGYFEPTTVDGYPAVFNDATDQRKFGDCALVVGIADKLVLGTSQQGGDGPKSCSVAKQVAAAVITTLKGDA